MAPVAVAVFATRSVQGVVTFANRKVGIFVDATFTKLPPGNHGFHIHQAGDLRGEGCKLACDHFHVGPEQTHGGPPGFKGPRHAGDLGNIFMTNTDSKRYIYILHGFKAEDLWGRSVIVHADKDDYGQGGNDGSLKTGNSGERIACAVIGRAAGN